MKLVFTPEQQAWLNRHINLFLLVADKRRELDGGEMLRATARLRHRFAPNAQYVKLKKAEAGFVRALCNHRLAMLGADLLDSEEARLVRGILEVTR